MEQVVVHPVHKAGQLFGPNGQSDGALRAYSQADACMSGDAEDPIHIFNVQFGGACQAQHAIQLRSNAGKHLEFLVLAVLVAPLHRA